MQKENTDLVWIDKARTAIEMATRPEELLHLRNKAEALRHFFKKSKASLPLINQIAEIRIRADRKCGELLPEVITPGRPTKSNIKKPSSDGRDKFITLEELGISYQTSHRFQILANIPEPNFEELLSKIKYEEEEEITSRAFIELGQTFKSRNNQEINYKQNKVIQTLPTRLLPQIKDNSIDLILTKPPYGDETTEMFPPKESQLDTWRDLAKLSFRVLKENKLIIVITGHHLLPNVFDLFRNEGLCFLWLGTIYYDQPANISTFSSGGILGINLSTQTLPILIFSKGDGGSITNIKSGVFVDVIHSKRYVLGKSNHPNKLAHDLQEEIKITEYLLQHFSNLNDIVFDPFSTNEAKNIVCKKMKRKFINENLLNTN